jgi:hypothetical protein
MLHAERQDLVHRLLWRRPGVMLGDRGQILQALKSMSLKTALVLVELCARNPALTARGSDVAQFLGQLKHTETLAG